MEAIKEEDVRAFGYDPYDAEWESPNTGRTVYRPGEDDDYCEICDGPIREVDGVESCACDKEAEDAL